MLGVAAVDGQLEEIGLAAVHRVGGDDGRRQQRQRRQQGAEYFLHLIFSSCFVQKPVSISHTTRDMSHRNMPLKTGCLPCPLGAGEILCSARPVMRFTYQKRTVPLAMALASKEFTCLSPLISALRNIFISTTSKLSYLAL